MQSYVTTQDVLQGSYIDYGRSAATSKQWLVSLSWGAFLTNTIAILVSISLNRAFRLALRVQELLGGNVSATNKRMYPKPTSAEGRGWYELLDFFRKLQEGAISIGGGNQPDWSKLAGPASLGTWYLLLFCTFQACGVFTSWLQTNSSALSSHRDAGFYVPNATDAWTQWQITLPYESQMQLDAATHSRDCYGKNSDPDKCSYFINPVINYSLSNWSCPFDGGICLKEATQPIRFSTGAVDARSLGVNAPETIEFNRTAICSPLITNNTFIRQVQKLEHNVTYAYFYGSAAGSPDHMTWHSFRHGNTGDIPTYDVGIFVAKDGQKGEWQPIKALKPPTGATVTIMFVASQKIFYIDRSDDPIFPATIQKALPPLGTFWVNPTGPGAVMACMDWTQWRDPRVSQEWIAVDQEHTDPDRDTINEEFTNGKEFTLRALDNSNIFRTMSQRMASALQAQSHISGFISLPLAKDQWRVEVQQLYETSLALVQIQMRNIARGVPKSIPGYVRIPGSYKKCDGLFLFNTNGWININWIVWWTLLGLSLFFIVIAMPVGEENLLFDLVLVKPMKWLWKIFLKELVNWLRKKVPVGLNKLKDQLDFAWLWAFITKDVWQALCQVFEKLLG